MATVEKVREFRESRISAGTVVARADGRSRELFPVAIGEEEGLALREWVRREDASRTLETGLGFAISTLFIFEALLANVDTAVATLRRVVSGLNAEQLAAPHPTAKFGTVLKTLVHLVAHFAVHRGQISYLVRLSR